MTQSLQANISADTISMFNQQVKYFKLALELADRIKPFLFDLLDKWDGKIYTKRFATALEKEFPNSGLWINKSCIGDVNITYYNNNERHIHSVEKDWLTNYINDDTVYFLILRSDLHNVVTVNAEESKERFEGYVNGLREKVETLSTYNVEKLSETKAKYLDAKAYFENTVNVIPYTVRSYLNIKL